MIALNQALIVEGRYDKIKLDSLYDGIILTTDGFNIFKDTEKQAVIRRLSEQCGVIVLTDSDDAGFKIRKYVEDIAKNGRVYHAYIPEVAGKERRKTKPGSAGLIGVEGVDSGMLKEAILRCAESNGLKGGEQAGSALQPVSVADLYEDGFIGKPGSALRRNALLKIAGLPTRLSTNATVNLLSKLVGAEQYRVFTKEIQAQSAQRDSTEREK